MLESGKISLRFLDSFDNYQVQHNTHARLQLSEVPLVGYFDIFVLRKDAPEFPLHSPDTNAPPFLIYGADSISPIFYNFSGSTHYGYRIYLNNISRIIVQFLQLGTTRSFQEIQSGLKRERAKIWSFMILESSSSRLLHSLTIKVVQRPKIQHLRSSVDQRHFIYSIADVIRGWTPEMITACSIFIQLLNQAIHMSQQNL